MTSDKQPGEPADPARLPDLPVGRDAAAMRASAADARAAATRDMVRLQREQEEALAGVDAARRRLEADFARQKAELERQMGPLRAQLDRLTEVAWTLDLYLGRDEQVTLLRDGQPAPASEPITIRQMVLAADEESLLLTETGGVDYRRMDVFIEWVAADPDHMNRIIPDAKGVVVVIPSRQERNYGDSVHNAYAAGENRRAHWLLRNGERLYLLITDPDLVVGDRLLPARDEFTSLFTQRDPWTGESAPLIPGSDAWLKAEQRAGALQRHYMRKMLVLQGIVDRSVVWRPLPTPHLNLLSVAAQDAGHVRLINELDMALESGRPRFRDWQRALNRRLRPGMRVILATTTSAWKAGEYDGDRWTRAGHMRLTPAVASPPPAGVPLVIEGRRDGGLIVRYHRSDEIWKRDVPVPDRPGYVYSGPYPVQATQRASCLIYPHDDFVLPFDVATEEDLHFYLNSREDRRGYLDMVPVLRSALAAKQAERDAESGFRDLLTGVILARHPGTYQDEVDREIPSLIRWWKTASKYARALAGDPDQEAKAVEAIAREWALRHKHLADPAAVASAVAAARATFRDRLLAVAWTRAGQFKAWTPAARDGAGPWLTEHTFAAADASWHPSSDWTTIHPRTLVTMQVLYASSRWDWWDLYPATGDILTGPETDALTQQLLGHMTGQGTEALVVTGRTYDGDSGRRIPARKLIGYAWATGSDLTDLTKPGLDDYLTCFTGTWVRERDGQVTMTIRLAGAHWRRYSGWPRVIDQSADLLNAHDAGWPWRDPDSRYWDPETDTRLLWHDPGQIRRLLDLHQGREHHRQRARQASDQAANYHYAEQIRAAAEQAWLREQTAAARIRFDADFGSEAADLWDHHLTTLGLDRRYRPPRWLGDMSRRLARARVNADGHTFGELAQLDAGLHTGGPVDVGEWAPWILHLPAEPETPADGDE